MNIYLLDFFGGPGHNNLKIAIIKWTHCISYLWVVSKFQKWMVKRKSLSQVIVKLTFVDKLVKIKGFDDTVSSPKKIIPYHKIEFGGLMTV